MKRTKATFKKAKTRWNRGFVFATKSQRSLFSHLTPTKRRPQTCSLPQRNAPISACKCQFVDMRRRGRWMEKVVCVVVECVCVRWPTDSGLRGGAPEIKREVWDKMLTHPSRADQIRTVLDPTGDGGGIGCSNTKEHCCHCLSACQASGEPHSGCDMSILRWRPLRFWDTGQYFL